MKRFIWLGILGVVVLILIFRTASGDMPNPFGSATGFGIWIAACLTLAIMSFLYNDNPLYRFAEHLFVGVSAAYWMVMGFWSTLVPNLIGKLAPGLTAKIFLPGLAGTERDPNWYLYFIPLIFGILLLLRLTPNGGKLSRWSLAFILGTTAGLRLIAFLTADFMGQIQATLKSISGVVEPVLAGGPSTWSFEAMFWDTIAVVAILAALCYFYFSKAHKGTFGYVSRVGIWVLMVTFGAGFGYTVMGRVALLVGRVEFLLVNWLGIS
jgi:hypothetical protein